MTDDVARLRDTPACSAHLALGKYCDVLTAKEGGEVARVPESDQRRQDARYGWSVAPAVPVILRRGQSGAGGCRGLGWLGW